MTTIVCPHCKTENGAEAEVCIACGQPLTMANAEGQEETGTGPVEREEVERWVRQLPEFGKLDAKSHSTDDESLPAWLQTVRAQADKLTSEEADDLMDFLADLEPEDTESMGKPAPDEAAVKAKISAELPAWVAALLPEESWPETEADTAMAQHFAEVEAEDETRLPSTGPLAETSPLGDSPELDGIPEMLAGEDLPVWLADQQAGDRPVDYEEPARWPGRARGTPDTRLPATASDASAPEPDVLEPEQELETIESALDELEAVAAHAPEGPPSEQGDLSGFTDWMDPAQSAALEETLEEILDLPDAETSEGRVDQWLDILEGLPAGPEQAQLDEAPASIELEATEVPDWMHSIRPEPMPDDRDPAELGPPEESGPLAGLRGVIPAATITLAGGVDRRASDLRLTKEQRQQAALLRRLTLGGAEKTTVSDRVSGDTFLLERLVLGGALLLVILVGSLVPGVADLLPGAGDPTLPPLAVQAHEAVVASSGRTALVAFEYTPSMAGELDAVADALLADLAANDVAVLTVSQVAAGVPMADRALAAKGAPAGSSIGYLPGEASGLRALGNCFNRGCDTLVGRQLGQDTRDALADVNLIVIVTGDRDSLANWLEQVGSQSDISIIGGVTQSLGPVARPYVLSEQLAGLVEGLPIGAVYGRANRLETSTATDQLASLTLAQWLVIGALLVGAIYFGVVAPAASAVGQVNKQ